MVDDYGFWHCKIPEPITMYSSFQPVLQIGIEIILWTKIMEGATRAVTLTYYVLVYNLIKIQGIERANSTILKKVIPRMVP